jgi:hypothetical protein
MRFVALVLLLPGCDRVFKLEDLDPVHDSASDGAGSGSGSDAAANDAPASDASPLPDAPIACPLGYMPLGNHNTSYKLVNTAAAFPIARGICNMDEVGITRHTHLVVLDDESERVLLVSSFGSNLWIGLVRIGQQNAFQPITDQATTFPPLAVPPWAGAQPSGQTGENCVRTVPANGSITVAGALDDQFCNLSLKYVCECDDFKDNPNH